MSCYACDRLGAECLGCGLDRLRAGLATSQADVTRLAAELAESVRALAVSRAENETTLRQHGDMCWQIEELRRALAVSQGEVERMRGEHDICHENLEAATAKADQADAVRGDLELARELLGQALSTWGLPSGHVARQSVRRDIEALLGPPTPTASPEPDRSSPEVTVKENDR